MSFANIPQELKQLDQWVCWRYIDMGGGKPTKVPYNPRNGHTASVDVPRDWSSFIDCVRAHEAGYYDGIGFVFTAADPYCGIDLDTPIDPETGNSLLSDEDASRQQLVYEQMASYSESSPSGKGLHIIVKARVPHGRKRADIEVYSQGRYFTFTGKVFRNDPIADRQSIVDLLWSQMGPTAQPNYYAGDFTEHNTDAEIYEKASKARNGDLFVRLWEGDTTGYRSTSEADFALVDIIAFYTKHRIQIRRMFMASALGKRQKYADAKPRRLDTLMGYMITKSFDRMLPPIDVTAILDHFNAAKAAINDAPVGADQVALAQPRAVLPDLVAPPAAFQGVATDTWLRIKPPGILGALVDFCYAASPRPVYEISLSAALGLMSGICGRAFNISGTGLNHYIMCLAYTGSGKEAISTTINRLMAAVEKEVASAMLFIGPAEIASGQGLLKHLADRGTPCFVSLVGEIGLRLQQMTHPQASTSDIALRRVMLDLFTKSGAGNVVHPTVYSDKKNNTAVIHSPAFSLLGDSTPEIFYKALDEESIVQGLLPRFTIIEYTGKRVPFNEDHNRVQPPRDLTMAIADLARQAHESMQQGKVIDVQATGDAIAKLRNLNEFADFQINQSDRDTTKQLWNRFHLKILKICGLLAISLNQYEPIVDALMVDWASSLIMCDTLRLIDKFQSGVVGSNTEEIRQADTMRTAIKAYLNSHLVDIKMNDIDAAMHRDKLIPYFYIQRRCTAQAAFRLDRRSATVAVKATIQNLIDGGILAEVPGPQLREKYKFSGKAYAPVNPTHFMR